MRGSAVITGGFNGLGLAFGRALLRSGYSVGLVDIANIPSDLKSSLDQEFGAPDRFALIPNCDVRDTAALQRAIKNVTATLQQPLALMVNNAGIGNEVKIALTLAINLEAVIKGTHLAGEEMRAGGKGGCIVNVASMGGLITMPFAPVYAATKAGVIHFSRSVAKSPEFAGSGIRVQCKCHNEFCGNFIQLNNEKKYIYVCRSLPGILED